MMNRNIEALCLFVFGIGSLRGSERKIPYFDVSAPLFSVHTSLFTPVHGIEDPHPLNRPYVPFEKGANIPVQVATLESIDTSRISLEEFIREVKREDFDGVTGLHAAGLFALRVSQQPKDKPYYVGSGERLTQYQLVQNGVIGLLTHSYEAGDEIKRLTPGKKIIIIYGNGITKEFIVDTISTLEALDPYSLSSDFKDQSGDILKAGEVFDRKFTKKFDGPNKKNKVVMQTCIEDQNGVPIGRYFVTAYESDSPKK